MQRSSWKVIMGIWKRMVIRATTACRISSGVPAGHISAGTLSMPFPKENSARTRSVHLQSAGRDSVEGANASAVVHTMVEMAKAHGLNIYGYLKFLLDHRPTKEMTDDQLAELAPWSKKLQFIKNCI